MTDCTIDDVRRAVWDAYQRATKNPSYEGKSSEGYIEVLYPNFWEAKSFEDFAEPKGVMIYSYALGPSRQHYFFKSDRDFQLDYATWYSVEPFNRAIEEINKWVAEFEERNES